MELNIIEKQICDLSTMPDFGYGIGNYCIFTERAKNWHLLSELIFNKDKFSWLDNHIKLAKLTRDFEELEQKKREQTTNKAKLQQLLNLPSDQRTKPRKQSLKTKTSMQELVQIDQDARTFI